MKSLLLSLLTFLAFPVWANTAAGSDDEPVIPPLVGAVPSIVLQDGTAEETIAAYDGVEVDVTVKGRKLNGKAWNVIVLPFDVKTFDFMKAAGRSACWFNVLESIETAAVTDVKFIMSTDMSTDYIPANTPFIVKPGKDYDGDLTFKKVIIRNATPTQVCTAGKFVGTYKTREVGETAFYAVQGGAFKKFTTPTVNIGFTRAYITLDSSAPVRFFIEEEDGTTSIMQLRDDTLEPVADGWYTVTGMRLAEAPTEKGVYIHNARKVVIK